MHRLTLLCLATGTLLLSCAPPGGPKPQPTPCTDSIELVERGQEAPQSILREVTVSCDSAGKDACRHKLRARACELGGLRVIIRSEGLENSPAPDWVTVAPTGEVANTSRSQRRVGGGEAKWMVSAWITNESSRTVK